MRRWTDGFGDARREAESLAPPSPTALVGWYLAEKRLPAA